MYEAGIDSLVCTSLGLKNYSMGESWCCDLKGCKQSGLRNLVSAEEFRSMVLHLGDCIVVLRD